MVFKRAILPMISIMAVICFYGLSYGASSDKNKDKGGYCCAGSQVFPATPEECKKNNGDYFDSKTKALNACKPKKGHCCAGSQVFPATPEECKKKNGDYFDSKAKALNACRPKKGHCCADEKVISATQMECKRKNGQFFSNMQQARKECEKDDTESRGVPKDRGEEPEEPIGEPVGEPEGGGRGAEGDLEVEVSEAGRFVRPRSWIYVRYSIDEPLPESIRISLRHYEGARIAEVRTLYEGAPEDTDRRSMSLALPPDITGEDCRILVVTIGEDTPREGESDSFTISEAPLGMNLYFEGGIGWRHTPVAGDTGAVEYTILCDGACFAESFEVGLMVDGRLIDTQTRRMRVGIDQTGGQFWFHCEPSYCGADVQVVIDPDNDVSETDETDNIVSSSVSCIESPETPKPDLEIASCSVSPWPIAEGETITFSYSILNTGRFGEVATGPFTVGLRIGDRIVQENRHAGMEHTGDARDALEGSLTWTAHCGEPIALVVDTLDEVDEGDETNNVYDGSGGFRPLECVSSSLDLTVSLFSVSDRDWRIPAGRVKDFVADIWAFRGDPRNIRVRCGIVGGEVLYDETLSRLEGTRRGWGPEVGRGERIRFSTALRPAGRTFRLYCEVDPENSIPESDETNNRQEYEVMTYEP